MDVKRILSQQRLEVEHRGLPLSSLRDHTLFLAAQHSDSQQQAVLMADHLFTLENTVRTAHMLVGTHDGTHKHTRRDPNANKKTTEGRKMSGRTRKDGDSVFDLNTGRDTEFSMQFPIL